MSVYSVRHTSKAAERLEHIKWSRQRIADTVQALVIEARKHGDLNSLLGGISEASVHTGDTGTNHKQHEMLIALKDELLAIGQTNERLVELSLVARTQLAQAALRLQEALGEGLVAIFDYRRRVLPDQGGWSLDEPAWDDIDQRIAQAVKDFHAAARHELGVE